MAKKENLTNDRNRRRFMTYKEVSEQYSIGLTKTQEYAKAAGAVYKIGSKCLVNTDLFEIYLEQFRIPGDQEQYIEKYIPQLI